MGVENLILSLVGISRQAGTRNPSGTATIALAKLFNKAKSSIKIVSGDLPHGVYCSDYIIDAIKRVLKKEFIFEIVVGQKANKKCQQAFAAYGDSVYVLEQWPAQHFAVVDGKHARLEEPHSQGEEKIIQYIIYNYKHAKELEKKFDALREKAEVWGAD